MGKMFGFKKQLILGNAAEQLLLEKYHEPLILAHSRSHDFRRLSDGAKVELKTDTYDMHKYPNFFMERWSDMDERKPGGPWRARRDRIDIFVYYFSQHGTYFVFKDIKELCARADKIIKRKGTKEFLVKNKTWVTLGYAVPRSEFEDLYTQHFIEGDV